MFISIRMLGRGTFGEVSYSNGLAVKTPRRGQSLAPEYKTLRAINRLIPDHPHIVQARGYDKTTESLKMEFLENHQPMNKISWVGVADAEKRRYYRQLKQTVADLHSIGYAHHDIAARNIMVDRSRRSIKLIDFGKAHPFEGDAGYPCVREDRNGMKRVKRYLFS
jgi:serine/threonine protein kinase